jgi:hypothetical protein
MTGKAMPAARLGAAFLLCGAASLLPQAATAQSSEELRAIREMLERQQRQLQDQASRIARQERLIEQQSRELATLRGQPAAAPAQRQPPRAAAAQAQAAPAAAAQAAGERGPSSATEAAAAMRREEQRILSTDPTLARVGGVLTPRGALAVEPTIEYGYGESTQATVNGFSIVPGITFGTVDIRQNTQRATVASVTLRYGVTDRFEINTRIPYVFRNDTIETGPADVNASPILISPRGSGIGDIEFGASYQINAGQNDWPIFIANLRVKSTTGRSPFEVPIYTINDPQGGFIRGLERELPTGTGFWSVEPGVTVAWASDPAVFFGGLRYIWNIADTVDLQNPSGGAPTRARLDPGDGIGMNFGVGFAMNERTSISLGYEHVFVMRSSQEGRGIPGSSADIGTFNFGLAYRVSDSISVNLGVGIGVTDTAPDARVILRVPVRFNLL